MVHVVRTTLEEMMELAIGVGFGGYAMFVRAVHRVVAVVARGPDRIVIRGHEHV